MPKPARGGYGESGPGKTHLLLGDQRHSRYRLDAGIPSSTTSRTRSSTSSTTANRPPAAGVSPGPSSHSALPTKISKFGGKVQSAARSHQNLRSSRLCSIATRETGRIAAATGARIAAANTRDSRGPQAQCPEDPDSQRSLTVHARTAATWVTAIRARRPSARLRRQRTRSNQEWRRPLCALRSAARPSFASLTTGPQCRRHGRRGEAT
jgi:hypothetical protein